MIHFDRVAKHYRLKDGRRHVVFRELTLTLPAKTNIGVLGRNGAGKSTLMNLLAGIERPTSGQIRMEGLISPPLGLKGGILATLSARENAKFLCRIRGDDETLMARRLHYIRETAELGGHFDMPVRTCSQGMRARLMFAINMAFSYDYYLIDELTAVGDEKFRRKVNAMFEAKREEAGIILVSHNLETLRGFCKAGLYVVGGGCQYYDDINDAIQAYSRDSA